MIKKVFSTFFLILVAVLFVAAQNKHVFRALCIDDELCVLCLKKEPRDSLGFVQGLNQLLHHLHEKSFIEASIQQVVYRQDTTTAFIYVGKSYQWAKLSLEHVKSTLPYRSIKEKYYRTRPFTYSQVANLQNRLIRMMDDHGYPFASTQLDSLQINNQSIQAVLKIDSGPAIVFDSIAIYGTAIIKTSFLSSYLGIFSNESFATYKIERANRILAQLPYIKIVSSSQLFFKNFRAYPVFFLDRRSSNRLDGFLGLLPNPQQTASRILITGQISLRLLNLFSTGKGLEFEWMRQRPLSQQASLHYIHPHFFNTGIDIKSKFYLLKEDTTFLNVNTGIAFARFFNRLQGSGSIFVDYKTSRTTTDKLITDFQQLRLADFDLLSYGIGYEWNNLDDYFYPRKGINLKIELQVGNKLIRKNSEFTDSLYQTIAKNTIQSQWKVLLENFINLSEKNVLFHKIKAGGIINDKIFVNDLFQIGGLMTLRGFNENFFYASSYVIHTLEYRYHMTNDTYFMGFYDQGYIQNRSTDFYSDFPAGGGVGISFSTSAGIVNVVYSLGNSKNQPVGFNTSKIHVGFISRF